MGRGWQPKTCPLTNPDPSALLYSQNTGLCQVVTTIWTKIRAFLGEKLKSNGPSATYGKTSSPVADFYNFLSLTVPPNEATEMLASPVPQIAAIRRNE
jgi:hypothetical protein